MGVSAWIAANWFDLLQTIGIVGGLLFTAYAIRRNEKALKISNLIAIKQGHRDIWAELYERPELSRVLDENIDLEAEPISIVEGLFVNSLILHLSTVHQALADRMFPSLDGLREDIGEFMSLPIPLTVWKRSRRFQNADFVDFVEKCLNDKGRAENHAHS